VACDALRDGRWERLEELARGGRKGKHGLRADNRRFLNALLWMARSGAGAICPNGSVISGL